MSSSFKVATFSSTSEMSHSCGNCAAIVRRPKGGVMYFAPAILHTSSKFQNEKLWNFGHTKTAFIVIHSHHVFLNRLGR